MNCIKDGDFYILLLVVICVGNVDVVCQFLKCGVDVYEIYGDGMMLLYWVVQVGFEEVGEMLIYVGVNVYVKMCIGGYMVLMFVVCWGSGDLVKWFFDVGLDVLVLMQIGVIVLMFVVVFGDKVGVEVFFVVGVSVYDVE